MTNRRFYFSSACFFKCFSRIDFDEFHAGVCRFPGGLDKHQIGVVQLHAFDQELF